MSNAIVSVDDRSRSREVTLGADDFDFSRDLAQVIDDDSRLREYEAQLRDELLQQERHLESRAIEQVSEQSAVVLRRASQDVGERQVALQQEWLAWTASSEAKIRQVTAQSEFALATVVVDLYLYISDRRKHLIRLLGGDAALAGVNRLNYLTSSGVARLPVVDARPSNAGSAS